MKAVFVVAALALTVSVPAQKLPPASSGKASSAVTAGDRIFDLTRVHRIRISISAEEWAVLQTSGGRSNVGPGGADYVHPDGRLFHLSSGFANYLPWAHADMRIDDADGKLEFKNVGIRYRGNSSFTRSTAAAPLLANFKIKIDLNGTKGTWDGQKTFNLQSGVVDASRMKDSIAYWVFRAAGVPAPRTTYAEIIFNVPGVYQDTSAGLFTLIEDVNKKFLERVMPPGTGLVMKPEQLNGGIRKLGDTWEPYAVKLRPDREATPREQQRVMEFSALVSQPDEALFREQIATYLDLDQFLRFIAVNAFISNTDSYLNGNHNFYLYLDPRDDKFRFIPWDQDLSLQGRGGFVQVVRPGGAVVGPTSPAPVLSGPDMMRPANTNQRLINLLLDDPDIAARYRAIIQELAATAFSPSELTKLMDALEPVSKGAAVSPRAFLLNRAGMVQQLVAGFAK